MSDRNGIWGGVAQPTVGLLEPFGLPYSSLGLWTVCGISGVQTGVRTFDD